MNRLDHCPQCLQKIDTFHDRNCRVFELNIGHQARVTYARRYGPDITEHPLRRVHDVDCELTTCGCSTVLVREYRRGGHRGFYAGYTDDTVCPRATWTCPLEPPENHAVAVWHALYQVPAGWDPGRLPDIAVIVDPRHDTLHTTGPFPTWSAAAVWLDVLGCFTPHHGVEPKGPIPHCMPLIRRPFPDTTPTPEQEDTTP